MSRTTTCSRAFGRKASTAPRGATCGTRACRLRAPRVSGGRASTSSTCATVTSLTMADRHCVYKECLKEVAEQMGRSVTFMAKYASELAGSSCHIHLKPVARRRQCLCRDRRTGHLFGRVPVVPWGLADSPGRDHGCSTRPPSTRTSATGRSPGRPPASPGGTTTAPPGFGWWGRGNGSRIECRGAGRGLQPLPGLRRGAGLGHGRHPATDRAAARLRRQPVRPPPTCCRYRGPWPMRSTCSRPASFCRESFGADVVEHYAHFFRTEVRKYREAVTDWERKRYFERI